jgi:hypothetical protein
MSPQRANLALQVKETGTPVEHVSAKDLDLQFYAFRDDLFGIYAYQSEPVIVDSATRDAFLNGSLADLETQAYGQGMEVQYAIISWNETAQADGYYITDLVVGAVVRVIRDYNTGPAYLIDAFKAVGWYNQMVSKMSMPWQSWLLLTPSSTRTDLMTWSWEAVSGAWIRRAPIGTTPPGPPSIDEIKSYFWVDGEGDRALGEFVRKMVNEGYQTTILGYKIDACYERSILLQSQIENYYLYKTHTRLTVDFVTNPIVPLSGAPMRLLPVGVWLAIAAAVIIISSALAAGVYEFLRGLTTTREETYGWVYNPNTGEWEWKLTGVKEEPPWWWSIVIPIVIVGTVAVIGVYVLPSAIKAYKETKRSE